MPKNTQVILQASASVFGFDANVDIQLVGGPASIRLAPENPVNFQQLWNDLSQALQEIAGFGLPDLGAWKGLLTAPTLVAPSLLLSPSGSSTEGLSLYLELAFLTPVKVGGSIDLGGGVTVSIEPNFEVWAVYIGYDAGAGGLSLRAKVTTPTVAGVGSPGGQKTQLVTYPFPVPSQDSVGLFKLRYLGLGQRVGPTVNVTAADPMAAIFDQLESELVGDDPETILTTLARNFYQPDREWFIAADVEMKGFRIRVLFNDPVMYGLEITVAANSPTPFAGLLFEILYQKLSPNLGVYYGALTLPTLMRRIPLEGFILILPGFSLWVYTNGDFRVNVGWPLGDNSIGISVELLVGRAGFYFAKLRSADNPGAQANANYDPILAFGIGVSLTAGKDFNQSIFSARLDVTLQATFQGLIAWQAGTDITGPPDHYWFAGTAGLAVFIQGTVDFSIIKASVNISFTANVGVAFETGYSTLITVSASVKVEVSIKILFVRISLSFHTTVGTQFSIGSGPNASVNGPLAEGLNIPGGFETRELEHARALETADRLVTRLRSSRQQRVSRPERRPFSRLEATSLAASAAPAELSVEFLLQPTARYTAGGGAFNLIASLVTDAPSAASPSTGSPGRTSFERLLIAMVDWLLGMATGKTLSEQFHSIVQALGAGSEAPLGDWNVFARQLGTFLQNACTFRIRGIDVASPEPERDAAVLPMLDALRLTYVDAHGQTQTVDFNAYNPAPANYPLAVNLYFEDLAWNGASPPQAATRRLTAPASPTGGPAMATFVLVDYFLLQARNAASALLRAALDYERQEQERFLARFDAAQERGTPDHWSLTDLVSEYSARIGGDEELEYLLAHFDYVSAAGMGSRFLLGGQQLPEPALVPAEPTKANMAAVPTAPLYVLTGQQFPVAAGAVASATLCLNPHVDVPAGWLTFDGASPEASTAAAFPVPAQLPALPEPSWRGISSPAQPGEGTLEVRALPPLTSHPLFVAMKDQLGWRDAGQPRTLLPLSQPLKALLSARRGLQLQLSAQPPPDSNIAREAPPAPLAATPALLIRLSLSQVPASTLANVTQAGSPVTGSPSTGAAARFVPYVYQLGGADEVTRDLILDALRSDLSGARVSLLYTATEDAHGSPRGSPANTVTVLRSEALSPQVLLAKTNLSTLNQVPEVSNILAWKLAAVSETKTDLAPITDVPGFLRLLWEVSVVNAPGFFLFYLTAEGEDLPGALFSGAGTSGGQTAEFDILVELAPAPVSPTPLPTFANAVFIEEAGITDALYAQVSGSDGQPVLTSAPTYPAGNVGLAMAWDRPESSPGAAVPVESLYHLLQYRIAEAGGYSGSVWSLPLGPHQENMPAMMRAGSGDSLQHYLQTAPAYLFFGPGSPAAPRSRYANAGQEVTFELRILDIYGDALPDVHTVSEVPLYHDPLVSLGEWPGLVARYRVLPGAGGAAKLALTLDFDPDSVVPPGDSPGVGIAPVQAWTAALGRYELILDQLLDPNTTLVVSTTLVGGPAGDPEANAQALIGLARRISENIRAGLAASASLSQPVVLPASATLSMALPFSAVTAMKEDIFAVSVSVALSRDTSLVYPPALVDLPAVAAVSHDVPADLEDSHGSPTAAGNLTVFAVPFEQAFQGFDGQGGCLKLAQRAGVHTGKDVVAVQSLWAVRWSEAHGLAVCLGDELTFFALQPLSTTPLSTTVGQETFSNVDLDAWARDFLVAFDAFLAPELAVAIGVLDTRDGTDSYDALLGAKRELAETIPLGVVPLFEEQAGRGDADAARERLSQALMTSLGSAFSVTTIVQVPARVSVGGASGTFSPDVAPRLFGSLTPPDSASPSGGASPARSVPYSLSSGELDLAPGRAWMTTLLTVAQPEQQAELRLPLSYQVSYLQHDFQPGDAFLGYVPSSWLKFALPEAAPLRMPITRYGEQAVLPIPLVFEPQAPILLRQAATAAALPSPGSPAGVEQELSDALKWLYTADLSLALARQDELFVEVTYNRQDYIAAGLRAAALDPRRVLLEALAGFREWYASASPQFATISAEAFPNHGPARITASPLAARDLIQGFQQHARAVADAWKALYAERAPRSLLATEEITDHFRLRLDSQSPDTLHVFGQGHDGNPPKYWPSIGTADGQWWHPAVASPDGGSPEGGWEQTATFQGTPRFNALTFEFGPLDLMERQGATMSAYVRRNAKLLEHLMTNPGFVYTTQTASFAGSIIPLIHRTSVPTLAPASTLVETLTQLLTPLVEPSRLRPRLRLSASYAYALARPASGPPLLTSSALLLTSDVDLEASPVTFVERVARSLAARKAAARLSDDGALLRLSLTLFGSLGGQELPLIEFDEIPINVAGLPPEWWQSGLTEETPP